MFAKIKQALKNLGMALVAIFTLGFYTPVVSQEPATVEVAVPEVVLPEETIQEPEVNAVPLETIEEPIVEEPVQEDPVIRMGYRKAYRGRLTGATNISIPRRTYSAPRAVPTPAEPVEQPRQTTRVAIGTRSAEDKNLAMRDAHRDCSFGWDETGVKVAVLAHAPHLCQSDMIHPDTGEDVSGLFTEPMGDLYCLFGNSLVANSVMSQSYALRFDLPESHPFYGWANWKIWSALLNPAERPNVDPLFFIANGIHY